MIVATNRKVNSVDLMKTKSFGAKSRAVLVLAHGAGAPADSPFMEELAQALEVNGISTVRFEFPYMQKRREDGRKRPPDRQPRLLEYFSEVVDQARRELNDDCLMLVGGKSMGGRMASVLASERSDLAGVVGFGYPFHPPGRLDKWRTDHFASLHCPMLVVQGTRDPFGKFDELDGYPETWGRVQVEWLEGGNHDFQPLARQKSSQSALIAEAARQARAFVGSLGQA
ncbi:alpha/beta family hydrolase [Marinobacter sediminum]|uniref:alpha/beta family hydrolase n=1 Tax=Marinobacter sediminum TaxID=256323 RepID=UPI0035622AA7